ncbi:hypothetical protein B0H19DRAFT_932811 [Mycena capillaripes]|nr:hypothetical protein B0H19DRAFT_932811 [Mycena capillaripes]
MFRQTHFLARHGVLLRALLWSEAKNPIYHDVEIDMQALAEYPAKDNGHFPFPIQYQSPVGSGNSDGLRW